MKFRECPARRPLTLVHAHAALMTPRVTGPRRLVPVRETGMTIQGAKSGVEGITFCGLSAYAQPDDWVHAAPPAGPSHHSLAVAGIRRLAARHATTHTIDSASQEPERMRSKERGRAQDWAIFVTIQAKKNPYRAGNGPDV